MPEENGGSGSGSEDVYVVLTFDDGPDTRVGANNGTAMVLDKLDAQGMDAVFFIQTHARDSNNNYNRGMLDLFHDLVQEPDEKTPAHLNTYITRIRDTIVDKGFNPQMQLTRTEIEEILDDY